MPVLPFDAPPLEARWLLPAQVGVLAGLGPWYHLGVLVAMCMAGVIWFGDAPDDWRRPLQTVGGVGVVVMSVVLTFKEPLRDLVRFQSHDFYMA